MTKKSRNAKQNCDPWTQRLPSFQVKHVWCKMVVVLLLYLFSTTTSNIVINIYFFLIVKCLQHSELQPGKQEKDSFLLKFNIYHKILTLLILIYN